MTTGQAARDGEYRDILNESRRVMVIPTKCKHPRSRGNKCGQAMQVKAMLKRMEVKRG